MLFSLFLHVDVMLHDFMDAGAVLYLFASNNVLILCKPCVTPTVLLLNLQQLILKWHNYLFIKSTRKKERSPITQLTQTLLCT